MRTSDFALLHRSRLRPLAACLALAFSGDIFAGTHFNGHAADQPSLQRNPDSPDAPQTWIVQNCTDGDADSLRDIIENPTKAKSGDTVDLSQLPALCGSVPSVITLTTGEITILQDDLTLRGPPASASSVAISGGGEFRVFNHQGSGTFALDELTIDDGYNLSVGKGRGGCISSYGSVYVHRTIVTNCTVSSNTDYALGGGIWAFAGVTLNESTVSGNDAIAPAKRGRGGGIYAASILAKYSSISDNVAHDGANGEGSFGGGAYATTLLSIAESVVDGNIAAFAGGLRSHGETHILSSTISGNFSNQDYAALMVASDSLTISNSTIAFNHSDSGFFGPRGAIDFNGTSNGTMELQSSIVANNTATDQNAPADIYILSGHGSLIGADNLVIATNVASPPPGVITVTADPQLGPLQFNGGITRTHSLLPGSPARDVGNNNAVLPNDQRGVGYPRTSGPTATVDIGALQFDTIFVGDFE